VLVKLIAECDEKQPLRCVSHQLQQLNTARSNRSHCERASSRLSQAVDYHQLALKVVKLRSNETQPTSQPQKLACLLVSFLAPQAMGRK